MAMQKAYKRIEWENYPSDKTPVNEENLNKIDAALDEVDNRVITLDTAKATKTEISTLLSEIEFNEITGVITFTRKNGSKIVLDTKLEKLAINFSYDQETEKLIITLDDGTKQYVDMSALITVYEFLDSETIAFQLEGGKVRAVVKEGSIQEKHLQPNYLAEIKVETAASAANASASAGSASQAQQHATAASNSAQNAAQSATDAETYAGQASDSATEAAGHADTASNYAGLAAGSASSAAGSNERAQYYAGQAQNSASAAAESASGAAESATSAGTSASWAVEFANLAAEKAEAAQESALDSEEWAKKSAESSGVVYASEEIAGITKPHDVYVSQEDGTMEFTRHTTASTLDNSYAGGIKLIGVQGASEQKQYSGKNLLPPRESTTSYGITYTIDDMGVVTANGATTASADSYEFTYFDSFTSLPEWLEKGVEYIASTDSTDSNLLIQCYCYFEDGTFTTLVNTYTRQSFIIPDTAIGLKLRLYVGRSVTLTDAKAYPMISVEGGDYEPYVGGTASPNPEYPQEIESVEVGEIKTHGNNHFSGWIMGEGINTENGGFYTSDRRCRTEFIPISPDTRYAISGLNAGEYGFVAYYDCNKKFLKRTGASTKFAINSEKPANCRYIALTAYEHAANAPDFILENVSQKVQIEVGSTATEYEPYTESVIKLPERVILRSNKDKTVRDWFAVQDGVWGVLRKISSYTFDGSEKWQLSNVNSFYIPSADSPLNNVRTPKTDSEKINGFCTHFLVKSYNATRGAVNLSIGVSTAGTIGLKFDEMFFNDSPIYNLKTTWLPANNPILDYELATPVFEPFADQTPFYSLKSYDGVTYITTDSAIEPVIEVEYGTSKVGALALENGNLHKTVELMQGSTDISHIGNGTLTGGLSAVNESISEVKESVSVIGSEKSIDGRHISSNSFITESNVSVSYDGTYVSEPLSLEAGAYLITARFKVSSSAYATIRTALAFDGIDITSVPKFISANTNDTFEITTAFRMTEAFNINMIMDLKDDTDAIILDTLRYNIYAIRLA